MKGGRGASKCLYVITSILYYTTLYGSIVYYTILYYTTWRSEGWEKRRDVRREKVRQGGREGVDSEIAMIGGLARCLCHAQFPFKISSL